MTFRAFRAYLDNTNLITLTLESIYDHSQVNFTIENKKTGQAFPLSPIKVYQDSHLFIYQLETSHIQLGDHYWIYDQDRNKTTLEYRNVVRSSDFEETFIYDGEDLGSFYKPDSTQFKFWAPVSEEVLLQITTDKQSITHPMTQGVCGVWQTVLTGDWEKARYHYLHKVNGNWLEVHDPYALSSTANSGDSYVIDRSKITPAIKRANTQVPMTQAIIYEMSVRDFTWQKEAGFKQAGKFLGLTESPEFHGKKIGLDYIKNLGVTHVQLMPIYDFGSVDEKHPAWVYNWGYDPVQYNVPEGSYSSQPDDPYSRITELQETIARYHEADISVIMDVVYNHVYVAETYAFEKIVPGYAYRYDMYGHRTNGTFCGNDIASERAMIRRYIKQSIKQWVRLYGMDGFRFDLMGILDSQTLNELSKELKAIYPNIYLYGEGWCMGTGLDNALLAHQYNANQLPDIGFFSDDFRNTIKSNLSHPHLVFEPTNKYQIEKVLTANVGAYGEQHFCQPHQAINYTECHDNATVFDYIALENKGIDEQARIRAARLALHLVLLAQGVPFIHSGQEVFRTKNLIDNSYNSPDKINQFDWKRVIEYGSELDFVKQLIAFRKAHPILGLTCAATIKKHCRLNWIDDRLLCYHLENEKENLDILINFASDATCLPYYEGEQSILLSSSIPQQKDGRIVLQGQTFVILG
ncbi:type I pullulanase [Streptococcus massiliensis]|uniref:Type II secretory pathway, pullulanase PulA glycosidase n=1 Tax=Streptococcus massiliensis TaxID=313439 RepID=A0A380KZF7_9STRE|nr:type I pullulanase [Streptococcus massiliensis]SUN77025.1 Type II secretory pathway, pullulanase PulA glycosidase [Streptococcus massiliensis]